MSEPVSGDASRRLAVTVYGSCVARDTVGLASGDRFALVEYVARQSLLSADSDASAHFPQDVDIESPFQERMMSGDFAGNVVARIEGAAAETEALLWDLTDERHGVHLFDDGSVITRSIDLIRQEQVLAIAEQGRHIPFGVDEHYEAWAARADVFADRLRQMGLFERTIVLQVPWALVTSEGRPTPWSMGWRARDANEAYRRYYEHLRGLGLTVIELQPLAVLADPEHQWGLAPFHYTQETYDEVARQIFEVTESQPTR